MTILEMTPQPGEELSSWLGLALTRFALGGASVGEVIKSWMQALPAMPLETKEHNPIRRVNIETPFAGKVEANLRYARACMRDSVKRGEAPIASHLLYTQEGILDDKDPEERATGIACGFAWNMLAEATIVYTDLGITEGMKKGIAEARSVGRAVEFRSLMEKMEIDETKQGAKR